MAEIDHQKQREWDDQVERVREGLNPYQRARMALQLRRADGLTTPLAEDVVRKQAPRVEPGRAAPAAPFGGFIPYGFTIPFGDLPPVQHQPYAPWVFSGPSAVRR